MLKRNKSFRNRTRRASFGFSTNTINHGSLFHRMREFCSTFFCYVTTTEHKTHQLDNLIHRSGASSEFNIMAVIIRICFIFIMFGMADTKQWRKETIFKGENVTICLDEIRTRRTESLSINFAGFTSKQHVTNVMIYNPANNISNESFSVSQNYSGRIERIEVNNSNLCFRLLNVSFLDSGNYSVSKLEGECLQVGTQILVARQTILGHNGGSIDATFMCNKTDISLITIEMITTSHIKQLVTTYVMSQANCTDFGEQYTIQIESCVLRGITLSVAIRGLTWLSMGTYFAWDDTNILLDSVFLKIKEITSTTHNQIDNRNDNGPEVDGCLSSEINGSDGSRMVLVTNVTLIETKRNTHSIGQFHMTGRWNDNFSFHLLNVSFVHNGDAKSLVNSCEDRNAVKLSFRINRHDSELDTCVFICNNTIMYSIKTDIMQSNITSPVEISNITREECSHVKRIKSCQLSQYDVFFTIPESSRSKVSTIAAFDNSGLLLDSINKSIHGASFENTNNYQTSANRPIDVPEPPVSIEKIASLLFISTAVVLVLATCLPLIAYWKSRQRRVPVNKSNEIAQIDRKKSPGNRLRILYENAKEALKERRVVSGKNANVVSLINDNKDQVAVRSKKKNIYHRSFDCADPSTSATSRFQHDSLAHLYDYILDVPFESSLQSSPNSTEDIDKLWLEYDYVVQHSFMTLRPPVPVPDANRKVRNKGTRADYKRLNIKLVSRVDPLTFNAEINKEIHRDSKCAVSNFDPDSSVPSRYIELESVQATGNMKSRRSLRYGVGPNWREVQNLDCGNFIPRLESLDPREMTKGRRGVQFMSFDYPRCHLYHLSTMDIKNRRSQSFNDMMAIANDCWSRSAASCKKKNCYDSL